MKSAHSVLLVDDDKQLVKLLKDNLQEQGYVVYCGYDGGMGVALAQRYRPDLILMDVNMPNVDGLQAFQKLRTDAKTAQIPVVFISEMMSQVIYPIVDSSPRAALLKKPLDLVDLNSFLRQFLQRYTAQPV
jgi:DNA-binding response OmpR family regulator